MNVDKDAVREVIQGNRDALGSAFDWGKTPQGHDYWNKQYVGETPINVAALKAMLGEPEPRIKAGETYRDRSGRGWKCLFVRDDTALMKRDGGDGIAYTWNAMTGRTICLLPDSGYDIPIPDTRRGTVDYVNGEPDFTTWKEDE